MDAPSATGVTTWSRPKNSRARLREPEQCCRDPKIPTEKQMMIRFSQALKSHAGRILPTLALLAAGIPTVAQQAPVSAPLSADEVMRRVAQMNEQRANALETYSSIRI